MSDLGSFFGYFFSSNYTFEVQSVCHAPNRRIDGVTIEDACRIQWNPDNTVRSYGPIERGQFEGNPDIAGIGIWWSLVTGLLLCGLGFLFILRELAKRKVLRHMLIPQHNGHPHGRRRFRKVLIGFTQPPAERDMFWAFMLRAIRALIVATADAQTVIALSYGLSFGLSGKCTISGYHYMVGINVMLLAFASVTLCVTIVRDYWAAPLAAFVRTVAHVVLLAFLGRLLAYEWAQPIVPEPLYISKGDNTDSSLLLPIACFLDPDLNPLKGLSTARLNRVQGSFSQPKELFEFYAFCLLALCFVASHIAHIVRSSSRYGSKEEDPQIKSRACFAIWAEFYWIGIILTAMAVTLFGWFHILTLEKWAHGSGWMETADGSTTTDEQDIQGIGQLGYLFTLFWVVVLCLDQIVLCGRSRK